MNDALAHVPNGAESRGGRFAQVLVYVAMPLLLVWWLLAPVLGSRLTPDSAAYWNLARSFSTDHPYRVFAVRDFFVSPELPVPSRSFPPLYPTALWAWDAAFNYGPRSGAAVNLIGLAALAVVWWRFARSLTGRGWNMAALAFVWVCVTDPHFREETAVGTPMVWQYLLVLAAAWLAAYAVDRPARTRSALLLGAVLGLLCLLRFDQALFAASLWFVAFVVILVRSGRAAGFAFAVRVAVVTAVVLSPWVARNLAVFGTPWAADNAITAASTDPRTVIMCAYEGNRPPSGRDDPTLWAKQRIGYAFNNLAKWNRVFGAAPLVGLAGFVLVAGWAAIPLRVRAAVGVLGLSVATGWASLSLTPFDHERYYSPWYAYTLFAVLVLIDRQLALFGTGPKWLPACVGLAVAAVFTVTAGYQPFREALARPDWRWRPVPLTLIGQRTEFDRTVTATGLNTPERPVKRLVAVEFDWVLHPTFDAESFHALTGVPTIHAPFHLAADGPAFRDWLARWQPDYLLVTPAWATRMGLLKAVVSWSGPDDRLLIDCSKL